MQCLFLLVVRLTLSCVFSVCSIGVSHCQSRLEAAKRLRCSSLPNFSYNFLKFSQFCLLHNSSMISVLNSRCQATNQRTVSATTLVNNRRNIEKSLLIVLNISMFMICSLCRGCQVARNGATVLALVLKRTGEQRDNSGRENDCQREQERERESKRE